MKNEIESQLKDMILEHYGSFSEFCRKTGIPNSTLASIFQRGIGSGTLKNIIVICNTLHISLDALVSGRIAPDHEQKSDIINILHATKSACRASTYQEKPLASAEIDMICDNLSFVADCLQKYHGYIKRQ